MPVLLGGGMFVGHDAAAPSRSPSIAGVWQVVEVRTTGPGAATISIPEPRPNLTIFTAKHYSRVEVHAETRPVPADPRTPTAEEMRAVWGPFFGEAGIYVTDGSSITMRPLVAKNPAAMQPGAFVTYTYKLEGDTAVVTEVKNQDGPIANPSPSKPCASSDESEVKP